jgi:hypothetical protein
LFEVGLREDRVFWVRFRPRVWAFRVWLSHARKTCEASTIIDGSGLTSGSMNSRPQHCLLILLVILQLFFGSISSASEESCNLRRSSSLWHRALYPSYVEFFRMNSVLAHGSLKDHQLVSGRSLFAGETSFYTSSSSIEYEVREDAAGDLNLVFFAVMGSTASGTVAFREPKKLPTLRIYYTDTDGVGKLLRLEYLQSSKLEEVFRDVICIQTGQQK